MFITMISLYTMIPYVQVDIGVNYIIDIESNIHITE
jgi:hypothetical protein